MLRIMDDLRYWLAPLPRPSFKAIFWGTLLSALLWHYVLKKPVYQRLYGIPDSTPLTISDRDAFTSIPDQTRTTIHVNGYDIEIQMLKYFQTTTRVVYVDRYGTIGSWYRSSKGGKLYDTIVPQDVSFASGNSGRHPECFKFSHEYRVLDTELVWPYPPYCTNPNINEIEKDISNNHSIAASLNVQKGLDILKAGDIAYIEGYAVYWSGTGSLQYVHFKSATDLATVSPHLIGGKKSILCRQLLITKLTFDGYTFE